MNDLTAVRKGDQARALWLSTIAFTVCFAVWTIFSIIGVQIKNDLGLNDTQFGLLVGTPILTGSLIRLILGIWADQYGGRIVYVAVMLSAAVATWLLTFASDYPTFLLAALGVGIAGGSFAVGIAYVSKWYPKESQGTALGIFGAGNVGAAVTKFVAPFIMVAYGWKAVANIWAVAIAVMAVVFWLMTRDDPQLEARRKSGAKPASSPRHAGALEEHPGVALLALLLLRIRRVRGAGPVAAALSDRRLRPRHHHRRHDRCRLLGASQPVPRLRRRPLRQIRRTPRDVLDVRRVCRRLLPAVLSAHRVHRAGHPRAHDVPARRCARACSSSSTAPTPSSSARSSRPRSTAWPPATRRAPSRSCRPAASRPTLGILGTVDAASSHVLENLDKPETLGPIDRRRVHRDALRRRLGERHLPPDRQPAEGASPPQEVEVKTMIIEGILAIQAGDNPRMIADRLMTFVPPDERGGRGRAGDAEDGPALAEAA